MKRVLLNSCDYFLLMLDESGRREGLPGNPCVALLGMEDVPSLQELESYSARLVQKHPCLDSRLEFSPIFRRARWKYPVGEGVPVKEGGDLTALLNRPLDARYDPPLQIHRTAEGVILRWHHALMDAKGAELLLSGHRSSVGKGAEFRPNQRRRSWWRRLNLAWRMRGDLRDIDDQKPAHFPHQKREGFKSFGLLRHRFDGEETTAILGRAAKSCGHFQRNLYWLASTFEAAKQTVVGEGPLVIPVPVNLRKKSWNPVVANYLTFFHFVVPQNTKDLPSALKAQNEEMIRREEDVAMLSLLHLGRRLGLSRYRKERTSREGRERVSVYFSYPGESPVTDFLGRPVVEYLSFPGVPARPGVGVFWGLSSGKLSLTVVFVRENVEARHVEEFVSRIKEIL